MKSSIHEWYTLVVIFIFVVNKKKSESDLKKIATKCFTDIHKILKSRRQKYDWDIMKIRLENFGENPAKEDLDLTTKLEMNAKIAKENTEKVKKKKTKRKFIFLTLLSKVYKTLFLLNWKWNALILLFCLIVKFFLNNQKLKKKQFFSISIFSFFRFLELAFYN